MEPVKTVVCPETKKREVIVTDQSQGITWCSRTAGKPHCAGDCLKKPLFLALPAKTETTKSESHLDS